MSTVFDSLAGNDAAVAALRAAAVAPVHAYLLVGPRDTGEQELVRAFAAAVLCSKGGCGTCSTCTRVARGVHPDVVEVARGGPFYSVDEAREIVRLAARKPMEGRHQIVVVSDLHLAERAAPALLKTVEEPAPGTVFVLLAEQVPPALQTVGSRCVVVPLRALPTRAVADLLVAQGVETERAAGLAAASAGRIGRARRLAADPHALQRRDAWRSLPERLDAFGATVAVCVDELVQLLDDATANLEERQRAELADMASRAAEAGHKSLPGRSQVEERQRREVRRWRTEELQAGLSALAGAYRDEMAVVRSRPAIASAGQAVSLIGQAAAALVRNPNERLLLQALLIRLSRLEAGGAGARLAGLGAPR